MANAVYPKYKEKVMGGGSNVNLLTGTVQAALIDITSAYTYSAAHEFWDDVNSHIVGSAVTLTGKSVTNGVFDCANFTFSSVSGSAAGAIVIFVSTGTPSTSPLVAYLDTNMGLPVTPDGSNIVIGVAAGGLFAM